MTGACLEPWLVDEDAPCDAVEACSCWKAAADMVYDTFLSVGPIEKDKSQTRRTRSLTLQHR